jgi:hypothetical protein
MSVASALPVSPLLFPCKSLAAKLMVPLLHQVRVTTTILCRTQFSVQDFFPFLQQIETQKFNTRSSLLQKIIFRNNCFFRRQFSERFCFWCSSLQPKASTLDLDSL